MEERWTPIVEFPEYQISDHGRVLNEKFGRLLTLSVNQQSIVQVSLWTKGVQYRRAVSTLVAKTYLPKPKLETFNTVINLDGDRYNNYATNLALRPRWFAFKYHSQFHNRFGQGNEPVMNVETGETYVSVWDAAIQNGLLVSDILESIRHHTHVWPTYQRFWRDQ